MIDLAGNFEMIDLAGNFEIHGGWDQSLKD